MTAKEQKKAAAEFAATWSGRGYEKGECQTFWNTLLRDVFGIARPEEWVRYEVKVATGYLDAYLPKTQVVIEQKGFEHGLDNGAAMKQAMMYVGAMPDAMPVRYVVLSNFQEFRIYDKHAANMDPVKVALKDLPKKLGVLSFLTDVAERVEAIHDVAMVDKKAGALVGGLYDALLKSYSGDADEHTLASLNMLCVRLVFCAYAEDAGVFPKRDQFVNYMRRYTAEQFRDRLAQLFRMLNTDYAKRDPDDIPDLLEFPYVGSGLFDDEHIRIPRFTEETRTLLLDRMCADIDWTEINPTIFGAVFESTLSTAMRRKNGMHYTTVKNIHRVIDPLFLDGLEREFGEIAATGNIKRRNEALVTFQKKLGGLAFLDPACGSGNFLTETYLSLRRLENRAIALRQQGQGELDLGDAIHVTIDQFHGIEIDGFAVSVAQTALWIAESQMMIETERILSRKIEFLPLKRYAHIVQGNALRMDWGALTFDYIYGNPPFVGARNKDAEQTADMMSIFVDAKGKPLKTAGNIDYVAAWYWKACEYSAVAGRHALPPVGSAPRADRLPRCAFVSTNSICQGEQVAAVWKPLKERFGVEIDFAWRTFVWDSEANEKAHVHVVIVGFHAGGGFEPCRSVEVEKKRLFNDDGSVVEASHINGYLMDGPDVFVESHSTPLCDVPEMGIGNKPIDGGNYLFTEEARDEFIAKEPKSAAYFRTWLGSEEFINGKKRYCLWLGDCSPGELRSMPHCLQRVQAVRDFRLASKSEGTRKIADTPTRFHVENFPKGNYLLVPSVSSERRDYVPMGFLSPDVISSNLVLIVPNASLYHFGILTSSVHMAWMRAVAGRLEMRYRYSAAIVYNNFPWPDCQRIDDNGQRIESEDQSTHYPLSSINYQLISQTAQSILDARARYPDSSLADLYDPLTMPSELRKAHAANDAAVLAAYGFDPKARESEIVARLFAMYAELTGQDRTAKAPPPPNPIRAAPENVVTQAPPEARPVTGAEFAAHCQFAHENFQALHSIAQRIDRNVAFMVEREKRDLTDHVYCWEALEKPRREQVKRVWDWMMDPKHANHDIWTLSRACDEVFSPAPGNYPTSRALYDFCHAHDAEFY